jgi:hypothetical protein
MKIIMRKLLQWLASTIRLGQEKLSINRSSMKLKVRKSKVRGIHALSLSF